MDTCRFMQLKRTKVKIGAQTSLHLCEALMHHIQGLIERALVSRTPSKLISCEDDFPGLV